MRTIVLERSRDPAIKGLLANSSGLAATLAIQVLTVPVFVHSVGVAAFADWLVLTAIPAYLSLSELGFAGAATTRATQFLARNLPDEARTTICSAWVAVTVGISSIVILGWTLAVALVDGGTFHTLSGLDAVGILASQLLAVAASVQFGFVEGALRAGGEFPRGILYLTFMRLFEFLLIIVAVTSLPHPLLSASLLMLGARVSVVTWSYWAARRRLSWFSLGYSGFDRTRLREIATPSFTYAGFSVGSAFLNQGYTILVRAALGAAPLVAFTTVRTMVNVLQQLVVVITTGLLPEITRSLAAGNFGRAGRLHRLSYLLAIIACSAAGALLGVFGHDVLRVWTGGKIRVSSLFLILMVLTVAADIPWRIESNLLRAANRHQVVGVLFLLSCVGAIGCAVIILPRIGLNGAPLSLFIIDLVLTPVAWRSARRVLSRQQESVAV